VTDERPDITTAKDKMRFKLGGGREVKKLPEHLWEGETVERMTAGRYGNGQGLIILTDRRLLFLKDGEMRDSGMITEEEFEAKKAEILGRM